LVRSRERNTFDCDVHRTIVHPPVGAPRGRRVPRRRDRRAGLHRSGLGRELEGLVEQGARRVVIDLSGLTFLDTTTLDSLLGFRASILESGGDVALVVGEGETQRFFELTGLEKVFSIYAERANAFRALALDQS
jgi:anti-anti-sigma factor